MKNPLTWTTVTTAIIIIVTVLMAYLMFWVGYFLPIHVNTSGNTTIPLNETAAQTVPSIVNGITTSTNIIIAFSGALAGILIGYVFKDDNRGRDSLLTVLFVFPFPLFLDFCAYISLAGGQGLFETAEKWALESFLYSLFALLCILIYASYALGERRKKEKVEPEKKEPEESKTTHKKKDEPENSSIILSERQLEIRIAQLNTRLQICLAVVFGAIAAAGAFIVFAYQVILETYPQITFKTVVGILFLIVALYLLIAYAYKYAVHLMECEREFDNLQ
jgi:hypothetical protein